MNIACASITASLLAAALVAIPARAAPEEDAPSTAPADQDTLLIPSCLDNRPPFVLRAADNLALLDAQDRARFQAALRSHVPVLTHDDFESMQVLLWGRSRNEWLYVGMLPASGESQACFTATFMAQPFEFTPELIRKYFDFKEDEQT